MLKSEVIEKSLILKLLLADKGGRYVMLALLAAMVLVPALNLLMPEGSFLHLSLIHI